MAQVSLTADAELQLRHTAGLRARAKRAVLGVLEAALEIRKLGTGNVHKDAPPHAAPTLSVVAKKGDATVPDGIGPNGIHRAA